MLIKLRKLKIVSEGYQRSVSLDLIYVNSLNVISIADFAGAHDFLLQEGIDKHLDKSFSLLKLTEGTKVEEIIALGSAEELYSKFNSHGKRILNG